MKVKVIRVGDSQMFVSKFDLLTHEVSLTPYFSEAYHFRDVWSDNTAFKLCEELTYYNNLPSHILSCEIRGVE